jgi:hypothetical protein
LWQGLLAGGNVPCAPAADPVFGTFGMNAIDGFWHIINSIAPALWLGLAMAAWDGLLNIIRTRGWPAFRRWRRGLLLDWGIGIAVLLAGLVLTGHDGRMLTYGALALAVGARHVLAARRRG